jgi:hypothetical protein
MLDLMTTNGIHALGNALLWTLVCPYPAICLLPLSLATNSAPAHPSFCFHKSCRAAMPLKRIALPGRTLARFLHAGLVTGMANIVRVFALRRAIVPPVQAKTH